MFLYLRERLFPDFETLASVSVYGPDGDWEGSEDECKICSGEHAIMMDVSEEVRMRAEQELVR